MENKQDYGKIVDSYIRTRDQAKIDLSKSRMGLLEMGVKTFKDDMLIHLPGLDVEKFEKCNGQEFYWEAEYKDGKILKQFDGAKQHHYGHIEQDKLKYFRWVSNFDYPTVNEEKRVIITLDFETGKFEFMNGVCPQDVRGEVYLGYPDSNIMSNSKLILKVIKRTSTSFSFPENSVDEVSYYNRYLIGWEKGENKKILVIEPSGFIHLWHE